MSGAVSDSRLERPLNGSTERHVEGAEAGGGDYILIPTRPPGTVLQLESVSCRFHNFPTWRISSTLPVAVPVLVAFLHRWNVLHIIHTKWVPRTFRELID